MGQQQLLLLVFGIVLIGGLVVAGAHALEGGKPASNRGMVFQEALAIVADLQAWKRKPTTLGGGANVPGFDFVDFEQLGYRHTWLSNRVYKTDFACYALRTVAASRAVEVKISAPSCAKNHFVARVLVRGTGPGDLDWRHEPPTGFALQR